MKTKEPVGHRVVIHRSNTEAFRGRYATPALMGWMTEHAGPVGILWKARWCKEGYEIFFVQELHAIHAALRWGFA